MAWPKRGPELGGVALLGALAALAVAGCGSGSSSGGSAAIAPTTPPAKGDVSQVTWGDGYGEPQSLDPTKAYNPPENMVLANMCESLLALRPDLTVGPGLASFTNPSPNTWVYNLHKGIRFWDGKPLTPADVIYSINRQRAQTAFWYIWSQNIASLKQTGPEQVTMTTKTPSPLTNEMMSTGLGVIGEASYIKQKGSSYGTPKGGVMCTGPFKFGNWSPGNSITMLRNNHYWDKSRRARSARFVFQFVSDDTTLTSGLLSGQLDGAYNVPPQGITRLSSAGTGKLYFGPSLRNYVLFPTSLSGVTHDPRIREALSLSIDRGGIANAVFSGHAEALRWAAPPDSFGYGKSVFQKAYDSQPYGNSPDIAKAKKLVSQAGNPSGSIVIAAQAGDTISTGMATDIASGAKQVGLHVEIRTLPESQFNSLFFDPKARAGLNFFAATDSYYDVADPIENPIEQTDPGAQYNLIGLNDPRITKPVTAALKLPDGDQRAKLVSQALTQWNQQNTTIPVIAAPERLFLANNLTGAPVSFTSDIYYPWAAGIGASG